MNFMEIPQGINSWNKSEKCTHVKLLPHLSGANESTLWPSENVVVILNLFWWFISGAFTVKLHSGEWHWTSLKVPRTSWLAQAKSGSQSAVLEVTISVIWEISSKVEGLWCHLASLEDNGFSHCGLVMPYGNIDPCQHWLRQLGSGNGLSPDGTKPLPEPMLTHRQWIFVAFTQQQF